jgi:hypothetical protein
MSAGALFVFLSAGVIWANPPVVFDITTSSGTDTLYVGHSSSIYFNANASEATAGAAPDVAAITWPVVFSFTGGNMIGPLNKLAYPGWLLEPGASVFELNLWSTRYGLAATDPDTILFAHLSTCGTAYNADGAVCRLDVKPAGPGLILIDTGRALGQSLRAIATNLRPMEIEWQPKTLHVVRWINQPPVCNGVSGVGGPYVLGTNITGIRIDAIDPDGEPRPLTYSLVSATNSYGTEPNNAPTIDSDGNFSWQTSNANFADLGVWEFCIEASDGDDAAVCCFTLEINEAPFCFSIDTLSALHNQDVTVCVSLEKQAGFQLAGGFDLLICFDGILLTFKGVTVGQALIDHRWEFFTYRLESTNPHKVRLVAIADMNNGAVHPDDQNPVDEVACLHFRTSNDRTVACQKAAIRFCWVDCGDNTVSSRDGYTLWVVGAETGGIVDITGEQIFGVEPDPWGYNATVVEAGCPTDKYDVVPFVCFENGWIRVVCPGEIDDRGDINLNGLAYEVADAILLANYFVWGPLVFDPITVDAQTRASDVNANRIPLEVSDFVYLTLVIRGEALPKAEEDSLPVTIADTADFEEARFGSEWFVFSQCDSAIGAAALDFSYAGTEITSVQLGAWAPAMAASYNAAAGVLRVFVMPKLGSMFEGSIPAGSGEILRVVTSGGGTIALNSAEATTDAAGILESRISSATDVTSATEVVPTSFALQQNYPNPFPNPSNPGTSFEIDFPVPSDYNLTIYNVAGQVVRRYNGRAPAGTLTVTWGGELENGSQAPSGVYFYRVHAGEFNAVRKMVLMK